MLSLFLLLAAQPCSDSSTPQGAREIAAGAVDCESLKPRVPNRPLTPADHAEIKAYFDQILLDGQSARYRFGKVKLAGSLACGFVNAKNRMGAYTGWQMFRYDFKDKSGRIQDPDKDPYIMTVLCEKSL